MKILYRKLMKSLDLLKSGQYGELRQKSLAVLRADLSAFRPAIFDYLDIYLWSRFRSTEEIILELVSGDQTVGDNEKFRLVLYSHFDSEGVVDDYVIFQLSSLASLPARIVFVSTAPALSAESISKIKPFCHTIIRRKNIGWDFGSWKAAMDVCPSLIDRAETLILMNDSCYGPIHPLEEIVSILESKQSCLSGITANREFAQHIQSYFILFPVEVLKSNFFKEFRSGLRYLKSKFQVIVRYEVGTSVLAHEHDIELYSWVKEEDLHLDGSALDDVRRNITIYGWDVLLLRGLSPFLKKSLFIDHKEFLGNRDKIIWQYLREKTNYPPSLIENHLKKKSLSNFHGRL